MKFKRFLLLLALIGLPTFATYQQQGFDQFQEFDGNIDFACNNQCIVLIGPIAGSDYATLKGTFQGNGIVGYGFLVGQQVVPGETLQINGSSMVDQQFSFSTLQFYSQIPAEAQLVLIVQGNITGQQVGLQLGFMSFYQKIGKARKDFWQMETLTPYSINLRYGVKLLGTSIVQYGYRIFIFTALYILLFVKGDREKKFRKIFFMGIGIFLFIGIRNFITDAWIVNQGLKNYTNQSYDQKMFFDLGDYITFTDKIRKELKLDEGKKDCKIYVDSFQDRPFKGHRESVYLKPCDVTLTGSAADYIIYYKKPIASGDLQKPILVNFNGSFLLKNK